MPRTAAVPYSATMRDPIALRNLRTALRRRVPRKAARPPESAEAAVALVLRTGGPTLEMLLIKRAENVRDPWSGHMALPGGRREEQDPDLVHTAFRETHEEVGIPLEETGELLGPLDEVAPGTRRLPPIVIAPFVVLVPPETTARPRPREVDAAFWIGLPELRDREAMGAILVKLEGEFRSFPSIRYREHEIWGLTRRILNDFLDIAAEAGL